MKKKLPFNLSIVCGYVSLLFLGFFVVSHLGYRHYEVDGQMYRAMHIYLPGYIDICYPEITVDLKKWAGTKFTTDIVYNADGTENPEGTAGLALLAIGLYGDDFQLEVSDGHFVLHRPERHESRFTLNAPYRIGRGVPVPD